MRCFALLLTGSIAVACVAATGCSSAGIRAGTGVGSGSGGAGGSTPMGGSGGAPIVPPPNTPCENLSCKQSTCTTGSCTVPACAGGARTTVSGTVFDPAGKVPLYNITVYVPNKPVADFVDGPSCDPCDQQTGTSLLSGQPITIGKSDVAGKFTLGAAGGIGGDVPAGDNIPLVIQVGKWRRQVTIPHVDACKDNPLTDMNMTRLPRTQAEGHIPKMALTTGKSTRWSAFCARSASTTASSRRRPAPGA